MTFDNVSLGEYYCLRNGKQSFSIDPWQDSEIYFGDQALARRISRRIESDFVQPRGVPKFFIHGSYGAGKTHTLAHIQHVLRKEFSSLYPTEPIYFDIAPLSSKERYERVHGRLLDAIGLDRVRLAVEQVADKIKGDKVEGFIDAGAVPFGDEALRVSQANVFRNVLFGGRQQQQSWEWMKGKKLTVDESQTLGVQKQLSEAQDFVNCLLNIGCLYKLGTGRRLVFLIDEGEAIGDITNADSLAEMQFVLRLLLENSNNVVGLVCAIQVDGGQEAIPQVFTERGIMRRVDFEQGYVDLNGLVSEISEAESFIRQAIGYLVDQEHADKIITEEQLEVDPQLFPFTDDAVEALAQHVSDNPDKAGPAAIISWMSNAAIEAWRRRKQFPQRVLVDSGVVEETVYPEG